MRILFLSTWFPYPPDNGAKIRVYHLLRALNSKHDVTLVSFAFGTARPEETNQMSELCIEYEIVRNDPHRRGMFSSVLRYLSPVPIVTRPVPEMTRAVQRMLLRKAFDAVIASTVGMARYALMRHAPLTKILEDHNSSSRQMFDRYHDQTSRIQQWRTWVSWQKARYNESRLLPQFDLCTMVSEQDKESASQVLPESGTRIEVVPNGVDCQYNRPGLARTVPATLIFNGALTYSANYDAMQYFLADIYPLIKREVPDISLTITGAAQDVKLSGLPLDASVRLSGYVDDIRTTVAKSDICVVPLRHGGGTRLKILEAMALGVPVVATSKGAEGLAAVDHEHILLADSPADFAARVTELTADPAMRLRLITNARRLVESRYDWTQIGADFTRLIEDTVRAT